MVLSLGLVLAALGTGQAGALRGAAVGRPRPSHKTFPQLALISQGGAMGLGECVSKPLSFPWGAGLPPVDARLFRIPPHLAHLW